MKNIYFCLLFSLLSNNIVFSQGANCASADPFCAGGAGLTFQNSTGTTAVQDVDYECLLTQKNPAWFFMQIDNPGEITFQISQTNNSGVGIDVDYICWGPFSAPVCGPTSLNPGTSISCGYSIATIENFTITNALAGEFYVILLTNYEDEPGSITVTQTNAGQGGAGSTDCNIICPLSLANQVICPGSQTTLTATIAGATSYQWSSSITGPITGNTQSINVTQAGTYTVVVNKPGCVANATATAAVSYYTPPAINLPVNMSQCNNLPNFNLNNAVANIFNGTGINPSDFEVDFHHSLSDAQQLISPISNASNYPGTNLEQIFVSLTDNGSSGCVSVFSFTLGLTSCGLTPVQPPNLPLCESSLGSGSATFDFTLQTPIVLGTNI
ncbi:MAG: hypothetical protein ACOYLT_08285, partial [Flavobacterium sp.]